MGKCGRHPSTYHESDCHPHKLTDIATHWFANRIPNRKPNTRAYSLAD